VPKAQFVVNDNVLQQNVRLVEISIVLPVEISSRRSKIARVSGALRMKSVSKKASFLKAKA